MNRVNLFIIGVNKAGTSWLYYFLGQHPDVFMSEVKELYFFGDQQNYPVAGTQDPSDLDGYHDYFPLDADYRYFGEATAKYYQNAAVADRIRSYNPEAKLLAIVRDPIERLLSQYRYRKQLGIFDEEITLDEALDGRDPPLYEDSHYEQTLPAYTERFGSDQFKILSLEAARDEPERVWEELLTFLDLPPAPCPDPDSEPENPTGSAAFRRVYRMTTRPIKAYVPRLYKWMLQSTLVRKIKLGLIRVLGTADSTSLSPAQEARLREEFAPTYAYLHERGFNVYDHPSDG